MWESTKIELEMERRLKELGSEGQAHFARYISARTFLLSDVLPWIRNSEPNLTDHGPEHIKNVLNNAYQLLGDINSLSAIEHYILCQAILFHDVGNLFGRTKHNLKIAEIYGAAFSGLWANRQEMALIVTIGRSHCGKSGIDGSSDTLKDLKNSFFSGANVNDQHLAALLRFADELAEGPQRTSQYIVDQEIISDDSIIFHKYAGVTHVHIDRGGGRIALSYHIELDKFDFSKNEFVDEFVNFMKYIYSRIHKLDGERRYCKHYCQALDVFKKTSVSFSFWNRNQSVDLGVPPIDLDDLFVPGTNLKNIETSCHFYEITQIVSKIKKLNEAADE